MANLLLVVEGTPGDLFPFLRMGKDLQARGHQVTLLSHWFLEAEVEESGLRYVALDGPDHLRSHAERAAQRDEKRLRPREQIALVGNHTVASSAGGSDAVSVFGFPLARTSAACRAICEQCMTPDTVVVGSYIAIVPAQIAAEKQGVPLAVVFPTPDLTPDWLTNLPFFDELYQYVGEDINRVRERFGLAPVCDWRAWLGQADLYLCMWPEWLIPDPPSMGHRTEAIGFLWDERVTGTEIPAEVERLLRNDPPPILVAHGTGIPSRPEFFPLFAEACEILKRPSILVTKYRDMVPSPLPDGASWFEYLPLGQILPHVAALVHHGGFNTAAQALAAGTPQLIAPVGYERPQNAARFKALGVAEVLSPQQWQPETVARLLSGLLDDAAVKRCCADFAGRIFEDQFGAKAYGLIEELAARTGYRKVVYGLDRAADRFPGQADPHKRAARIEDLLKKVSPSKRALLSSRLRERLRTARGNGLTEEPDEA